MIARSIHPIPACPDDAEPAPAAEIETAPRVRRVTNDPAREYAQRDGEVEPLPNSVAALILCKKGWAKIERHQIKVSLDGEDLFFASRDSMVIVAENGTGNRVLWALNRRAPELLHLLTADGAYIESVPRKGQAEWFSRDEESQRVFADAKAQISRDAARLRDLHTGDTAIAAQLAQENAATTHRLVQSFPASAAREAQPAEFPKAEEIVAAMRDGEVQHERHTAHVQSDEQRQKSALKMGEALRADLFKDGDPTPTEDLGEAPAPRRQNNSPLIVEL